MDQENLQRIRKGTKSCIECRQRKIRCDFVKSSDSTCQYCATHHKECRPQLYKRQRETTKSRVTSQARLERLERQIERIAASVTHKGGTSPAHENVPTPGHLSSSGPLSAATVASPPTHLKLLFDNAEKNPAVPQASAPKRARAFARAALQRLLPPIEDVRTIIAAAGQWMVLYQDLLPKLSMISTPQETLNKCSVLAGPDADPVHLGALLITIAMTLQQGAELRLSIRDIPSWIRTVVETTQSMIIHNHDFAATMTGIEMTCLYLRLQLSRGDIRDVWMTSRRMVSVIEFMGIHRLLYERARKATPDPEHETTFALLEAVFATDRMASMMFNLPSATSIYNFPPLQYLDESGNVIARSFTFELTPIAMQVQDFDEAMTLGQSFDSIHEKVLLVDSKLRAMAARLPSKWWSDHDQPLNAMLAKHFYYYVTVRLHLHAALHKDPLNQYVIDRKQCLRACQQAAQVYIRLGRAIPPGFFLTRILQMQIFTVATVLLLSLDRDSAGEDNAVTAGERKDYLHVVDQVIRSLESERTRLDFTIEAATALRSLQGWLQAPESMSSESLTLRVPLLGRVLIGHKHRGSGKRQAKSGPPAQQVNQNFTQGMSLDLPVAQDTSQWSATGFNNDPAQSFEALPWMLELDFDSIFNDFQMNDFTNV